MVKAQLQMNTAVPDGAQCLGCAASAATGREVTNEFTTVKEK